MSKINMMVNMKAANNIKKGDIVVSTPRGKAWGVKMPKIQFIDGYFKEFNVMEPKHLKIPKYTGRVQDKEPSLKDHCTCMSFTMRNTLAFELLNRHVFQCKHIKEARRIRYEGYP